MQDPADRVVERLGRREILMAEDVFIFPKLACPQPTFGLSKCYIYRLYIAFRIIEDLSEYTTLWTR